MKLPVVYILTNKPQGVLYIGVTSNLPVRFYQHVHKLADGFTSRYGLNQLVYVETHSDMIGAITREKQLKNWKRDWKVRLIEEQNPEWRCLSSELF